MPALEKIWRDSKGQQLADFNFRTVTSKFNELVYQYPIRIPERYSLVIRSLLTQVRARLVMGCGFRWGSKFGVLASGTCCCPAARVVAACKHGLNRLSATLLHILVVRLSQNTVVPGLNCRAALCHALLVSTPCRRASA